jgi:acyl-CoA synthetase (AMP-forming)/AMP-acid ligase II
MSEERILRSYDEGAWTDGIVGDLLRHRTEISPDAVAVIDGERWITWGELADLSGRLATGLRGLGVARGDAVILQLPNWWEHVVSYLAIHLVGGVAVQVGVDWRSREVDFALGISSSRIAIVPRTFRGFDFLEMYRELARSPDLQLIGVRGQASGGCVDLADVLAPDSSVVSHGTARDLEGAQLAPDEISRVVFTSGTTGSPKAILHTTNTTRFSSRTIASAYMVGPNDVALSYLPLSTNAGTVWSLYLPLETGMSVALLDRFSADRALSLMEDAQTTLYCGSPTSLRAMVEAPGFADRRLDAMRLLISSGATCPPDLIAHVRRRFRAPFVEVYGMNEIGWATSTQADDDPNIVDGTVGRPYGGVKARVVNDDGVEVPAGAPGELLLLSPGMCVGYHANPELAAATWDDQGWLRTGDYVSMDDQGNVTLVSRKKDLIIRGGANVSPREVEEAIADHPKVEDVIVVGVADELYGERVCACVIPRGRAKITLEELQAYLSPRIAFYKIPTQLVLFEEFPTTSMGKVRRNILREQILAGTDEQP